MWGPWLGSRERRYLMVNLKQMSRARRALLLGLNLIFKAIGSNGRCLRKRWHDKISKIKRFLSWLVKKEIYGCSFVLSGRNTAHHNILGEGTFSTGIFPLSLCSSASPPPYPLPCPCQIIKSICVPVSYHLPSHSGTGVVRSSLVKRLCRGVLLRTFSLAEMWGGVCDWSSVPLNSPFLPVLTAVPWAVGALSKSSEPTWDEGGGRNGIITFPNPNPLMATLFTACLDLQCLVFFIKQN